MKNKHLLKFKSISICVLNKLFQILCIAVGHIVLLLSGILIGSLLSSNKCEARVVHYGSEIETITVAAGGPTIFRFNEEVKTISRASRFNIGPSDKNSPDYALLEIRPRFTKGKSKVTFLLSSGAVVSTNIVIVSKNLPEKTDSFYDFVPKENLIEKNDAKGAKVTDLELMKAMIRWEDVLGYKARSIVRTIDTGNKYVVAKLVRIYTGPLYNGYVFKLRNLASKKSYAVDLKTLSLGNPDQALLSQVDRSVLKPSGSKENVTFLRVVSKTTSLYYNVNLPVGPIQKK